MQSFTPKSHRSVLAKLRCGVHVLRLRIESGRFVNLPKESRMCELCTLDEVENEKHFICNCTAFSERGKQLYNDVTSIAPVFSKYV